MSDPYGGVTVRGAANGTGLRSQILGIRFTPAQLEILNALAAEQDITVSSLVRRAVSQYLFEHGGQMLPEHLTRIRARRRRGGIDVGLGR